MVQLVFLAVLNAFQGAVTAEAAGSSPVVPAIPFNGLQVGTLPPSEVTIKLIAYVYT